jgi:selenobiotic family peptide radical SAM maturase
VEPVAPSIVDPTPPLTGYVLNPTLEVHPLASDRWTLVWRDPEDGKTVSATASDLDLLALKVVAEGLYPWRPSPDGPERRIVEEAVRRAREVGLVLGPPSRLRRDPRCFGEQAAPVPERFLVTGSFGLQWHITQRCDLRCLHCYDRSDRPMLSLAQGERLLDELVAFCHQRGVLGDVTFTGGNPFLHPDFLALYRAAVERGLAPDILGNPVPRALLEGVVAVAPPESYQVSLEGLPEHNDRIRGAGHFARVIAFLDVLRDLGVPSGVMLTVSRDNLDQVLPLAERLSGRADWLCFSRLSRVGEAASLERADPERYAAFLEDYQAAAERSPLLVSKENLLNILRYQRGADLDGGCTGFGCGAAFNFLAVLSDGEAHACRKYPSRVGHLLEQSLAEIYDGPEAERHRAGSRACRGCPIRAVCGGCAASVHDSGLSVALDRDPYCFMARDED